MTLGNHNRHQYRRKKEAALAKAFPQGIRCQKCLDYGHWSYECTGKRKNLVRPSRSQIFQKNMKSCSGGQCSCSDKKCKMEGRSKAKKKKTECSDSSDCSDSSSDSGSLDSDDDSDDSSSDDSEGDSESSSEDGSESSSCSDC